MLLHFTDLHFARPAFAFISAKARELSADVCITGDLIDQGRGNVADQIAWVSAWVQAQPFQLFMCGGNQDAAERPEDPFFVGWMDSLHNGTTVVTRGCKRSRSTGRVIGCVPYGYVFPDGPSPFGRADVLLHHEPPMSTGAGVDRRQDWGSSDLTDYLLTCRPAPALVLCGHVHTPEKCLSRIDKVTICNPGASDSADRIRYARVNLEMGSQPRIDLLAAAVP